MNITITSEILRDAPSKSRGRSQSAGGGWQDKDVECHQTGLTVKFEDFEDYGDGSRGGAVRTSEKQVSFRIAYCELISLVKIASKAGYIDFSLLESTPIHEKSEN